MNVPDPFAAVSVVAAAARTVAPSPVFPDVRPGSGPLPQAIKSWREASVGWIRADNPDAAASLAARRPPSEPPRLVVLGETNRGKSSLINALLAAPGLSPVNAGVATCSYLVFVHADPAYAVARFGGGLADITFPLSDLREWATVDGEPDVDIPPPRWIEIGLPVELTRSLVLVDTPGVGGLVAAHGELAAEAAAAAAALLFVIDASAPFTRSELDFLALVSDRVDAVQFAVTKTDAYRGWREIVDADRALLARHAPRFTDALFHPVSSRLAEAARAQADPATAKLLADQSGVDALRATLVEQVATAASLLAEANVIRTSITVLAGGIEQAQTSRRALTAGAAQAEKLKARRERLMNRRRAGGRSWQVMLRAEIQRARVDLTHETAREVREAAAMFRGSIDHADGGELKNMPFHIDAYAQAMTARAHTRLQESMGRICHSVLSELFTPGELTSLTAHLATRPYEALVVRTMDHQRNMDETIMTLGGAGMGFTLSRVLLGLPFMALPAAFGVVLAPISVVVGGAAAFYLLRSRRRMADKQHLKQWLMDVLGEAKAQIDQGIAEQFVDAEEQLTLALDDALTRQVNAVEAELREVDGALKLDASERAGRLRTIDERTSSGTTLLRSGEDLVRRIRAARIAVSTPFGVSPMLGSPPGLAALVSAPARPPVPAHATQRWEPPTPVSPMPAVGPRTPPPGPPAGPALAGLAALAKSKPSPAEPEAPPASYRPPLPPSG